MPDIKGVQCKQFSSNFPPVAACGDSTGPTLQSRLFSQGVAMP